MGNYNFKPSHPFPKGTKVKIIQNRYTQDNEMPNKLLYTGIDAIVVKTEKLIQSNPQSPPIYVTTVVLPNKKREVYLSTNLKRA